MTEVVEKPASIGKLNRPNVAKHFSVFTFFIAAVQHRSHLSSMRILLMVVFCVVRAGAYDKYWYFILVFALLIPISHVDTCINYHFKTLGAILMLIFMI